MEPDQIGGSLTSQVTLMEIQANHMSILHLHFLPECRIVVRSPLQAKCTLEDTEHTEVAPSNRLRLACRTRFSVTLMESEQ